MWKDVAHSGWHFPSFLYNIFLCPASAHCFSLQLYSLGCNHQTLIRHRWRLAGDHSGVCREYWALIVQKYQWKCYSSACVNELFAFHSIRQLSFHFIQTGVKKKRNTTDNQCRIKISKFLLFFPTTTRKMEVNGNCLVFKALNIKLYQLISLLVYNVYYHCQTQSSLMD